MSSDDRVDGSGTDISMVVSGTASRLTGCSYVTSRVQSPPTGVSAPSEIGTKDAG